MRDQLVNSAIVFNGVEHHKRYGYGYGYGWLWLWLRLWLYGNGGAIMRDDESAKRRRWFVEAFLKVNDNAATCN